MSHSVIGLGCLEDMAALASRTPPGEFVEVGVYKGGSALYLARVASAQSRRLYLYDTFTGMPLADPAKGDKHHVGDFSDTSAEAVQRLIPSAILRPGVFSGGLFVPVPVAFAHIDCDQYESLRTCFEVIVPHMVPGGIMLLDDVGNPEGGLDGANLATAEFAAATGRRLTYRHRELKPYFQF